MQGHLNYSLQGFLVESGAVLVPGGDAACQDPLHSATVELSENFELRPNFFSLQFFSRSDLKRDVLVLIQIVSKKHKITAAKMHN